MSGRRIFLFVALIVLATLPYWMPGSYYVNIASQILFYAVFALAIDILLGYGGLVSLGHAGIFGVSCYIVALVVAAGWGHFAAIVIAIAGTLIAMAIYALVALRATGIGFLMITLALGQILWGLAYRWITVTNGDNGLRGRFAAGAIRFYADIGNDILLCDVDRISGGARGDRDFHSFAVRCRAEGHARSAAAHERARLQRLDDPVLRLPVLRVAHCRRRHSVRLLQRIHQSAGAGAHRLRRGRADGDLRRRRDAVRPGRWRCAGRHHEERRQRLYRAVEFPARRDLRRHRHVHAGRHCAGHRAPVALAPPPRAASVAETPR